MEPWRELQAGVPADESQIGELVGPIRDLGSYDRAADHRLDGPGLGRNGEHESCPVDDQVDLDLHLVEDRFTEGSGRELSE